MKVQVSKSRVVVYAKKDVQLSVMTHFRHVLPIRTLLRQNFLTVGHLFCTPVLVTATV